MRQTWISIVASLLFLFSNTLLAQTLTIKTSETEHTLTQEQLKAIKPSKLTTITPWTDQAYTFEGIALADLLAHLNIITAKANARALNDYVVEIDIKAAINAGAFVASHLDGKAMSVRKKGPFWIVFPWSEDPKLNSRSVHTWAIWQMVELKVE